MLLGPMNKHPQAILAISREKEPPEERVLRVLVIDDAFPGRANDGSDLRLIRFLHALRDLGDEVTFIARETVNAKESELLLQGAGIHTYGNDVERLRCLGHQADTPSWCFRELVEQAQFDIAILIESFERGVSVPEQYLDDLRRYSPGTRIAVCTDELHVTATTRGGAALVDLEKIEDWANRQWETFERADAVIAACEDDAATLRKSGRNVQVEVVSDDCSSAILATLQRRMLSLTPRTHVQECCSVMLAETVFRERLSQRTGENRALGQLECYVRLAEQFLREGNPEKGREQLRHVFGRAPDWARTGYFASQVFILLKRCYRELGDREMAARCAMEARGCVSVRAPALWTGKQRHADGLSFSLIVPTYNRLPILRKCLEALEAQTLSSKNFEVIVVDDGSSDGTEALLSQYRPPFRFQYLRQTNSGTGAARRIGVAHASGEYLLLMNDDTICAHNLLEEHLLVQREYASEQWAVLGNFEYPAAALQRALTRYFSVEPFMFPQVSMEEGCPYGYSHFITCNVSVRREAVMEAGSFDSTYKLSEDTELGIRLFERGYRVLYHPAAHAFHDHLPYPARNLIRRARVYGADYFHMFRRHPRVVKEWSMPVNLTGMDEENAIRILGYIEDRRHEVEEAVSALERWDCVDFEPFLEHHAETAITVLRLFQQAVPAIHWFYLFETMLQTMIRELGLGRLGAELPVISAAQGAGA
jgi:GT2 family glycosyltransferase